MCAYLQCPRNLVLLPRCMHTSAAAACLHHFCSIYPSQTSLLCGEWPAQDDVFMQDALFGNYIYLTHAFLLVQSVPGGCFQILGHLRHLVAGSSLAAVDTTVIFYISQTRTASLCPLHSAVLWQQALPFDTRLANLGASAPGTITWDSGMSKDAVVLSMLSAADSIGC